MLSTKLHTALVLPPSAYGCQHACHAHQACIPCRELRIVRASSNQSQDDSVLAWSPTESATSADAAADADTPDKRHRQSPRQPRQGQQGLQSKPDDASKSPPSHHSKLSATQQQHRTRKQRTRSPSSSTPVNPRPTPKMDFTAFQPHRPNNSSHGRHTTHAAAAGSAADPYWEAQQRVRALLAAADPNDPGATAAQLPDTVNDLTIALQLLATAPRPASLAAQSQYDAAVQQMAAAVLQKYKQLLLRLLPAPTTARPQPAASTMRQQQQQQQQQQWDPQEQLLQQQQGATSLQEQQQLQLVHGLASLPATKLAATAFSLGVLRLYDRQLVGALEEASLLLLHRNAFKANQLGQIIQGFVYLDHPLNPEWHAGFLAATRRHMHTMQGPQLTSIAVWLLSYGLSGIDTHPTSSSSSSGLHCSATNIMALPGERSRVGNRTAGLALLPATAAAAGGASSTPAVQLVDASWAHAYLAAVGRQAGALKPLQLVQVLQAAAGLWQQLQAGAAAGAGKGPQQLNMQHGQGSSTPPAIAVGKTPQRHTAALGVGAAPEPEQPSIKDPQAATAGGDSYGNARSSAPAHDSNSQPQQQGKHDSRDRTSSSGQDSSWAMSLVAAVQQQLPELTMAHLAAALPALLVLTQHPWPPQLLAPVLLQIKVQLPASAGKDLVAVAQAAALLAGADALEAEQEWCDAVLVQLHAQLPTLTPAELAGAVNAAALMQVRPYKAWVYALCQRLRVDARVLDAQQTLVVLEGLAAVGIQLDPEVLHAFVLQIQRFMGLWDGSELGRVAQALRSMYPKVLPGRSVQQLVGELQRRQQFLALQSQQQEVSIFGL